jgi:hypothetical protein
MSHGHLSTLFSTTIPMLAFAVGMAISGALVLAVPAVQATSPTLVFLPGWSAVLWGLTQVVGGVMTGIGLWRGRPDYESSGLVLLSTAQLVAALAALSALSFAGAALALLLRGSLAIALAGRAYFLVREGST